MPINSSGLVCIFRSSRGARGQNQLWTLMPAMHEAAGSARRDHRMPVDLGERIGNIASDPLDDSANSVPASQQVTQVACDDPVFEANRLTISPMEQGSDAPEPWSW